MQPETWFDDLDDSFLGGCIDKFYDTTGDLVRQEAADPFLPDGIAAAS